MRAFSYECSLPVTWQRWDHTIRSAAAENSMLLRQSDITCTGSADRKSGSSRECTVCTRDMQVSVQMATTLSINCNWWYCVRIAKATFPYWKLLFSSSIFKQLLPKNCVVEFVEICKFCTRKVIIKAARRIFNSDKICRSYCDFYFGVTFLEHKKSTLKNIN